MRIVCWFLVAAILGGCSKRSTESASGSATSAITPSSGTAPAMPAPTDMKDTALAGRLQAAAAGSDSNTPKKAQVQSALPGTARRVQKGELRDDTGFGKPMLAATALIPAGWKTSGGIVWGAHGSCGADYAANWKVSSPDGVSSFASVAAPTWVGTRSSNPTGVKGPCIEAFWLTAREYLEAFARQRHPDARVLGYTDLADEAKPYKEVMAQYPQMSNESMRAQSIVDAGELLIGYSEGGREMREVLSTLVFINHTQFADVMNPSQIGIESISGFPGSFTIVTAPEGQLDRGLRKRISSSMRFTPEWSKAIAAFNARKMQQFSDAMAAGHAARMAAIKKTGDMINGAYEDRTLTNDRMQRESIEAIRGVETYTDTDGRPVQIDNSYNHVWRAADDTYILTNDPSFNPGQYGIEAKQLEVTK